MSNIYNSITDTIGSTPLVRLNFLAPEGVTVLAKCESFNPCHSVKDRIAKAMIEDALDKGRISDDTVIIEPTSGNTGIGLAFICAVKGFKLKLTMPESMSIERRKLLQILGAEIVLTPAEKGMKGAVERANELLREMPNAFIPSQFTNPANPDIHEKTTAREIWNDTGGKIDYLVAGVGTGGTITGCGRFFKAKSNAIKMIAVEPEDSAVLSGGNAGPHKIQGIGAGFVPEVLDTEIYDEIIKVSNADAFETAAKLASKEGMLSGISAGANAFAAIEVAKRPESQGKTIVFILCDTGERYISTELFA